MENKGLNKVDLIFEKIDPKAKIGSRITNIVLSKTGEKLDANKSYKVAGWSTVGAQSEGEPIWETVETYLKNMKHISKIKIDTPDIVGVKGNPGII